MRSFIVTLARGSKLQGVWIGTNVENKMMTIDAKYGDRELMVSRSKGETIIHLNTPFHKLNIFVDSDMFKVWLADGTIKAIRKIARDDAIKFAYNRETPEASNAVRKQPRKRSKLASWQSRIKRSDFCLGYDMLFG